MADDKKSGEVEVGEAVGIGLLKDLTLATMENARVTRALVQHIGGVPGEEGFAGLMENVMELSEATVELADRMTGLTLKVSMVDYVLDKMGEIKDREPNWRDAIAAKQEFDKKIEEEIIQAEKAEEQEEEPAPKKPDGKKKHPMVENSKPPHLRKTHPLPVAPPRPG